MNFKQESAMKQSIDYLESQLSELSKLGKPSIIPGSNYTAKKKKRKKK